MPGWLVHTAVFKKHHKNVLGAILPDYLPFLKCFDFYETHDLAKAIEFKKYLRKVDKSSLWLAKGWISHIVLDKAAEKNKKLSLQRKKLNNRIGSIIKATPEKTDEMSDLLLDVVMDGMIGKRKKFLSAILEASVRKTNLPLISKHIVNFWGGDIVEVEEGLQTLTKVNFGEVTSSVQKASHAYLKFYGQRKRGLLTKIYGLYLRKILRKHKNEINYLINHSEEFFNETEGKESNLNDIMQYFQKNHSLVFNQKFYISKKQDST